MQRRMMNVVHIAHILCMYLHIVPRTPSCTPYEANAKFIKNLFSVKKIRVFSHPSSGNSSRGAEKSLNQFGHLQLMRKGQPLPLGWTPRFPDPKGSESATPFQCRFCVHSYLSRWFCHRRLAIRMPFVAPRQNAQWHGPLSVFEQHS
jgi:hypothetical protein